MPNGVIKVFRASTRLGMVIPRVFMDDTDADRAAIQNVVNQIAAYPLAAYDGKMKITEWTKAPNFPGDTGNAEVKWVKPELFADQLSAIIDEVPPLPGEEASYAQIRSVLAAAEKSRCSRRCSPTPPRRPKTNWLSRYFSSATTGCR